MTERTEKLRQLMAQHRVKAPDVATILNRSPATVRIWRCKNEARTIPENELRLLELELTARAQVK